MTASIAAHAIGPPPNVVPSRSSFSAAETLAVASSAAQGKPLPSALAVVIMSGMTPYRFAANGCPMRPTPHCTSSKMSTRADFVAAAAQRLEIRRAQVDRARQALHGLDDDRRRLVGDVLGDRGDVAARDEADIERARAGSRTTSAWRPR